MAEKDALPTNQTGSLVNNINALLQTFGGTKTTSSTNSGDITALQNVLGQLQGADYNAMLQSIFQQAGGQIPGLQIALGNAIGARSGGNSAVAAALQKLLQQTSVAAQDQIAKQQLANQQTQVQAGQAVANATKGTQSTQQQGTNVAGGAAGLAKAAALTQLLASGLKLTGNNTLQDAITSFMGSSAAPAPAAEGIQGTTAAMQGGFGPGAATITSAPAPTVAPQMSMAPGMSSGLDLNALLTGSSGTTGLDLSALMPPAVADSMGTGSFAFEPTAPITPDFSPSEQTFVPDETVYEFGTQWWE